MAQAASFARLLDRDPIRHCLGSACGACEPRLCRAADMTNCNLNDADLQSTNLQNATLKEATCQNADFYDANLTGACLVGADLTAALLQSANLHRAGACSSLVSKIA